MCVHISTCTLHTLHFAGRLISRLDMPHELAPAEEDIVQVQIHLCLLEEAECT